MIGQDDFRDAYGRLVRNADDPNDFLLKLCLYDNAFLYGQVDYAISQGYSQPVWNMYRQDNKGPNVWRLKFGQNIGVCLLTGTGSVVRADLLYLKMKFQ